VSCEAGSQTQTSGGSGPERPSAHRSCSADPASHHGFLPMPDPALAHLGHLCLKPAYWGSGIAAELLARAVNAASTREFNTMRLFVPVKQARPSDERRGTAANGGPGPRPVTAPSSPKRETRKTCAWRGVASFHEQSFGQSPHVAASLLWGKTLCADVNAVPSKSCQPAIRLVMSRSPTSSSARSRRWP
jgi:hypothetical protein